MSAVVNVASVPKRSPFRYPGGKTWLVPRVRTWLASIGRPRLFVEPFAGGAIIGLTVAFEDLADRVLLVEKDADVSAVWRSILGRSGEALSRRVETFSLSRDTVCALLARPPRGVEERAFQTLVKNRVQHGGIMAPGASLMKNGENGKGITSRWYPQTIARRIRDIAARRKRIGFLQSDALDVISSYAPASHVVFFIDPPYTVAGRRLYPHSDVDHARLFELAANIRGDFLMTYDSAGPIRKLAESFGFDTAEVAMKNTHHAILRELLIGRDLAWLGAEMGQLSLYPALED